MRFFANFTETPKKREPKRGALSWLLDLSILGAAAVGAFVGFLVFCLIF